MLDYWGVLGISSVLLIIIHLLPMLSIDGIGICGVEIRDRYGTVTDFGCITVTWLLLQLMVVETCVRVCDLSQ